MLHRSVRFRVSAIAHQCRILFSEQFQLFLSFYQKKIWIKAEIPSYYRSKENSAQIIYNSIRQGLLKQSGKHQMRIFSAKTVQIQWTKCLTPISVYSWWASSVDVKHPMEEFVIWLLEIRIGKLVASRPDDKICVLQLWVILKYNLLGTFELFQEGLQN